MYKLVKKMAHRSNYGSPRPLRDIEYLVYHYTANDGDTAWANANYFQKPLPTPFKASAHYFVDDTTVYKSVMQSDIAWAVGDGKGQYGITNANSVSIEMCDTKKNGKHDLTSETRSNAIILGRNICRYRHIPESKVARHFDASRKCCPAYFCGSEANDKAWRKFRSEIFRGFAIGAKYERGNLKVLCKDAKLNKAGDVYILTTKGWLKAYDAKTKTYLYK